MVCRMSDAAKTFTVIRAEGADTIAADRYEIDEHGYLHFVMAEDRIASYAPGWTGVLEEAAAP